MEIKGLSRRNVLKGSDALLAGAAFSTSVRASAPPPEPAHHLTHQTITGQRGRPEDVAATVRFLCGPGARHITGQAIHTNGGAYLGA